MFRATDPTGRAGALWSRKWAPGFRWIKSSHAE